MRTRLSTALAALLLAAFLIPRQATTQGGSATGRVAGGAVPQPVAVMPFRNLNEDPSLQWLSVGMAETMLSDLRREGMRIVERDALDTALAEMALQGVRPTDESTAARVGQLAGAKTMVFGGYQTAGGQIRITARFVEVETSVVLDAAMATGPIGDVLSLQDEIVSKLIGRPVTPPTPVATQTQVAARRPSERPPAKVPGKATTPRHDRPGTTPPQPDPPPTEAADAPAPRRPSGDRAVEAYRLYAMSLTTRSDAERVDFLQRALEIDEGFVYAAADLRALQQRMRRYRAEADRHLDARAVELRRMLTREDVAPTDRAQQAFQLLQNHMTRFRYRALLQDAQIVYDMEFEPWGSIDPREFASYAIFLSYVSLKEPDRALQAGERHLQEFPAGMYFTGVEMQMNNVIRQREERAARMAQVAERMEKIAQEREEALGGPRPPHPARLRGLDYQRCSAPHQLHDYERALDECEIFASAYEDDEEASDLVLNALWTRMNAYAELGRFEEAREVGEMLMEAHPDFARSRAITTIMGTWPQD
jgi:TolB-like protein/tetratricopeptide (TPR) repeat protein